MVVHSAITSKNYVTVYIEREMKIHYPVKLLHEMLKFHP